MRLVSIHADGSPHRTHLHACPTAQRFVYIIPPNTPVLEADGEQWSSAYPVVAFFWPQVHFQVFMLLKSRRTDYYCNIILPPVCTRQEVTFVDLDLDVLVLDGQVELVDKQEFGIRKAAYKPVWITQAEAAAQELLRAARCQWGPFLPATAQRWRVYVEQFLICESSLQGASPDIYIDD